MKQSNLVVWWRAFDASRTALGLSPARLVTAHWFWSRSYLPEEAAAQDRQWLAGLGRLMGTVG